MRDCLMRLDGHRNFVSTLLVGHLAAWRRRASNRVAERGRDGVGGAAGEATCPELLVSYRNCRFAAT